MNRVDTTTQHVLDHLASGPTTGPTMARGLDVSRAAVWKQIETLRDVGFAIESDQAGYRVTGVPEYGAEAVAFGLDAPYSIAYQQSVSSTNEVARSLARDGETDLVLLADEQPAGRGRLDRSWVGPSGGIYLSILIRPQLEPVTVPLLTLAAAVATVESLTAIGIDASIKWPNDVVYHGQKLAGILTEMEGEADRVNWAIVGIGLNANVDPALLPDTATSVAAITGETVSRREIVQSLLERFHTHTEHLDTIIDAWRVHTETLGRSVRVKIGNETVEGVAEDITASGSLQIRTGEGNLVTVHAGDCEHLRPHDED